MSDTEALTAQPPAKPRKQGSPRKGFAYPGKLPLAVWQTVRTMYLVQGCAPSEIALALQLPAKRVSDLVSREGWSKQRRGNVSQLTVKSDAHAQEQLAKTIEAHAILAEHGATVGLSRAVEAAGAPIHKDNAQAFRAYAGGARDLVNIARQARGLDSQGSAGVAGATFNLTQLVVQPREKPVVRVEEAAQVIDVTALPVAITAGK